MAQITKIERQKLQDWYQAKAAFYWNSYRELFLCNIGKCPELILNGRLSATAGYNYPKKNLVHLSLKFILSSSENRREITVQTLPHELAHQIDWNLNKNADHGPAWKNIMVRIGRKPHIYHNMVLIK